MIIRGWCSWGSNRRVLNYRFFHRCWCQLWRKTPRTPWWPSVCWRTCDSWAHLSPNFSALCPRRYDLRVILILFPAKILKKYKYSIWEENKLKIIPKLKMPFLKWFIKLSFICILINFFHILSINKLKWAGLEHTSFLEVGSRCT